MAKFQIIGSNAPFIHCHLERGEKIFCESDAMVMMEEGLTLKGQMRGGFLQSVARKLTTGESLFQQEITADKGSGDCLLAAPLDGGVEILEVGGSKQYFLNDGAFVAATSGIELKAAMQRNLGGALFGGTGGFVLLKTEGSGEIAVSGLGEIFAIDVVPSKTTIIDNGHIICWDASLNYQIAMGTKGEGGFFSNMVNSVVSGEGIVLKFNGSGKVYLCSRNRGVFSSWIKNLVGAR